LYCIAWAIPTARGQTLTHGCMTLPGVDGPAPGMGHRSPEAAADQAASDDRGGMKGMEGMEGMHHSMAMKSLPLPESAAWVVGSFAVLLAALWLTHLWGPIRFAVG
jgi:hypothetical protein